MSRQPPREVRVVQMEVENISQNVGARIHVNRGALLDEQVARRCLELLDERGVLVFPRIGLTDEEQIAFTDRMGVRLNFRPGGRVGEADKADIFTVTLDEKLNLQPEYVLGTFFWHMDGMPTDYPPPKATVLTARRVAPRGGQTEFASTRAAYEALTDAEKAELAGLRVHHSAMAGIRSVIDVADEAARASLLKNGRERPLVFTSQAGWKSLLIGYTADYIVDMPKPEGRALLARLLEWAAQPAFVYRHQWEEGDLVIWNNCSMLHRVVPYDRDCGRMMHRTSIAGVEAAA
jgi:alpha-ketoglutarate-dependent taurine dioxygenase